MKRNRPSSGEASRLLGWVLVTLQLALLTLIFVAPWNGSPPPPALRVAFRAVAVIGVAAIAWGALALGHQITPHPAPPTEAALRTGGPYRLVRHPIYSGVLALGLGVAGASGSRWKWGAFLLLLVVLTVKARYEESLLRRRFPEYDSYAARTPRFLPGLRMRRPER